MQNLFMSPFTKLGRVFNLNRSFDMWLIDKVFHRVGKRDRKDSCSRQVEKICGSSEMEDQQPLYGDERA